MNVEQRFRLDRAYKGPFGIKSLTTTKAVTVSKDDENAEERNVSNGCQSTDYWRWLKPPPGWDTQGSLRKETSKEEKATCTRVCTTGSICCQFARGCFH